MCNREEDITEMIGLREVCYGIVDGAFRHREILYLMDKSAEWSTFMWYATIISNAFSIQSYQQLAGTQNKRKYPAFYI